MLRHLAISNFQAHHATSLDLRPFTCIVGPSGFGKSSLIRALSLLSNPQLSLSDITHGYSTLKLSLALSDDTSLTRIRSKTTNKFIISTPKGQQTFDKIGKKVPDEILSILNLPIFSIDDEMDHLYLARQFDPPYLIFSSPTHVARTIMSVTGVDQVVAAHRLLDSDRRTLSTKIDLLATDLDRLGNDKLIRRRIKALAQYDAISVDIAKFRESSARLNSLKSLRVSAPRSPEQRLDSITTSLPTFRNRLESLPRPVDLPKSILTPISTNYNILSLRLNSLKLLASQISETADDLTQLKSDLIVLNEEKSSLMGDICPLCGQKLDHSHA